MNENKINDGGPAFPRSTDQYEGMSLRDYFAGQALAGLISQEDERPPSDNNARNDVKYCYKLADVMLAERKKGTQ